MVTGSLFEINLDAGENGSPPEPQPRKFPQRTPSGFAVVSSQTVRLKIGLDGKVSETMSIANFSAKIVAERIIDDGVEQRRQLVIEVKKNRRPPITVELSPEEFSSMNWPLLKCGATYVIQAGANKKDLLRLAIQEFSGDQIREEFRYAHLGWCRIGDQWRYLHGGGAIGVSGNDRSIKTDLSDPLSRFVFDENCKPGEIGDGIKASLKLAEMLPEQIGFSLLGAIYRAPLGECDFSLWMHGRTGAGKSELASLAAQHFGREMSRTHLPCSWASTPNALEKIAFEAKDALLVIDDFCPTGGMQDVQRLHASADRLLRSQGNGAGRQRLNSDCTSKPSKAPRGLLLITGEDLPRGHSANARLWSLELKPSDVNLKHLTTLQRLASEGAFERAMMAYLRWVAKKYEERIETLRRDRERLRSEHLGRYVHSRTPEIVGNLLAGFEMLLQFAIELRAISTEDAKQLRDRAATAIGSLAQSQGEFLVQNDPVKRFKPLLASLLTSGKAHLASPSGYCPSDQPCNRSVGWDGNGIDAKPLGDRIGWIAGDAIYLDPETTYAAMSRLLRDQGEAMPLSQSTLFRRLRDAGIITRSEEGRTTIKIDLQGARKRVLAISRLGVSA